MKKNIIAGSVIALLGIGYVGTSWYTGNVIEKQIDEKIAKINMLIQHNSNGNITEPTFNISYSDYRKGIFSTTFQLNVDEIVDEAYFSNKDIFSLIYRLTVGKTYTKKNIFNGEITIYHGPFPWSELKSGHFSPKMASILYQTSQQSDETENIPFITGNAIIDYNQAINATIYNKVVNYDDPLLGIHLQANENTIALSTDSDFKNITFNGQTKNIQYQANNANLELNNLTTHGQSSNIIDVKNYHSNLQLNIENMILSYLESPLPIKLNQITMDVISNQNDNKTNSTVTFITNNMIYGKQNLGKIDTLMDFAVDESVDTSTWIFKLNKFQWHTPQGNLNARLTFEIASDKDSEFKNLDQSNIKFAEANIELPFNTLAYLGAQMSNPEQDKPSKENIDSAHQTTVILSQLLLANLPLFNITLDAENSTENGIKVDLYYSKEEDRANLNGKELTTGQFWYELSKTPQF